MAETQYLKDLPLKINDTVFPFTKNFTVTPKSIENQNQSETGKDIVQVARKDKKEVTIGTTLTGEWVDKVQALYLAVEPLTVYMYDRGTHAYKTYQMRLLDPSYKLKEKSEDLGELDGVWDISFKLREL